MSHGADEDELRREVHVLGGVVQGIGFRPFVHRLATELSLDGWVGNSAEGVVVDVQGSARALETFAVRLLADAPPLATIDRCRRRTAAVDDRDPGVVIRASGAGRTAASVLVPPDTAVCDDCLRELLDPLDRRHGHPFITCTNCGPRFTIIRSLPYDRPATTMADFVLCDACRLEYEDPNDRRHHAQPIGCLDCGPRLWFRDAATSVRGGAHRDARLIEWAVSCLRDSCILALKGLGGYHLVCDARSQRAVATLRERKQRPDKPLAVMVRSVEAARELAFVSDLEAEVLRSPSRPIVLLRATPENVLAPGVAPDNPMIGVMLPYTPVHHLLFADPWVGPLVMTSGNVAGEPIVYRDDDALHQLGPIVDAFLGHDREIHAPCDDSVVRIVDGRSIPFRRGRGAAPIPVTLDLEGPHLLAVGGELKNTFAVARPTDDGRTRIWLSPHIGDMGSLATLEAFESAVEQFCEMYGVVPEAVLVDNHPGYQSSRWARRRHPDLVVGIGHHEAHIGAVLAEHHVDPSLPIIGFAFDGTGYGADGTIWGGEVFAGTAAELERVAHLAPIPLPGGDAAIRHPSRVALAHLFAAGLPWSSTLAPVRALAANDVANLRRQLERSVACVPTTSMGRLFDAVAALLGLRQHITFEAQAAIELETAALGGRPGRCRYHLALVEREKSTIEIDPAPMFTQMLLDIERGRSVPDMARGFHDAVVTMMVALARQLDHTLARQLDHTLARQLDHTLARQLDHTLARQLGNTPARPIEVVALSGGVFQNALLVELGRQALETEGFTVLTHRLVPPNDGGLALGQIYLAMARSFVPCSDPHLAHRPLEV